MSKILVVDDEKTISDIITFTLKKEGYEVIKAFDGQEALDQFHDEQPDLILLDLMLPEIDGLEVARRVRAESMVPIIILTAKSEEIDKVLGLELGADDYITKPFSNRELVARIKANLRRSSLTMVKEDEGEKNKGTKIGDLEIHEEGYYVSRKDEPIELTHKEYELFHYLAQHLGEVVTRQDLLQTVWGYDYFGDARTVDVTIRRLREKIEEDPSSPSYILTRRGVGYYLTEGDSSTETDK